MTYEEFILSDDYKDITKWECTDPDNLQYCYELSNESDAYVYKEFDHMEVKKQMEKYKFKDEQQLAALQWNNSEFWEEMYLNINDFSKNDIKHAALGYYEDKEIQELWEQRNYQLLLECKFEYDTQY